MAQGKAWLVGCAVLVAGGLGLLLLFWMSWMWVGGGGTDLFAGGAVGHVVIEGPISDVRPWVEEIEANRSDPAVKAVVVSIDSPGGAVAPSQELHAALLRLAREKPLVASLGSVAASGGYYAAVAADTIVANPGTVTGSIGVIFEFPTLPELLETVGVEFRTYKSGAMKDMGTFTRPPTDAESDVLDGIIADVYDQFVVAVADGRGLPREDVAAVADGRIFTGRQARDIGLVDRLGTEYDALRLAARMAGLPEDARVVRKARPMGRWLSILDRLLREGASVTGSRVLAYRYR